MNTLHRTPRQTSIELTAPASELIEKFSGAATARDVAGLLEIPYTVLVFHLFRSDPLIRYRSFRLRKASGGTREISAPATPLKIIQQKLNCVLQLIYEAPVSAHGFVINKSIATNAIAHVRKRFVLNIDIQNFFGAINFGRVRGLFLYPPYSKTEEVATILAKIACHQNALPQGAPTSPVISNMICSRLDKQLARLAREYHLSYSRYADDISLSSDAQEFPRAIAYLDSTVGGKRATLGGRLQSLIESNGFEVNAGKVRLQSRLYRQEVTGLVVNEKRNINRKFVRQIRAMLHAWRKFGLAAADQEYGDRYNRRQHARFARRPRFQDVVRGKIEFLGMIRGKNDPLYLKHLRELESLPGFQPLF